MVAQSFQLNDFDRIRRQEEDDVDEEETEFGGGSDESDLLGDNLDWLSSKEKNYIKTRLDVFGTRAYEARNLGFSLKDLPYLERDNGYTDVRFIKYLIDTQDFTIKKIVSVPGLVSNKEISYYGEPILNDNDIRHRPFREFKTVDGVIQDPDELNQCISDIRYHYDRWRKLELDKILERSGLATGIGLTIIALITGLSLGLKRSGTDIVHNAEHKTKKLTLAKKIEVIPWTDIEKASGKGLILIGDSIYLIIGATLIYLYSKK